MISTTLPNIETYNNEPPSLTDNALIFATTAAAYFYPEHKTPYLFVTNFLNKGRYVLNKNCIEISDKQFYFLNANDDLEVNFSNAIPLQTLFILFEENFIKDCFGYFAADDDELLKQPSLPTKHDPGLPNVPFVFTKKIQEKTNLLLQNTLERETFNAILFEILTEFSQLNAETEKRINKIGAVKKTTKEELYRRVFLAREFMNDNVFKTLSLEQIAKEACLNKYHFLSNFKSIFNTTPHQYHTALKLQEAARLLHNDQHSVTEICWLLGFESLGSFSNLFKKRFGVSPSNFINK